MIIFGYFCEFGPRKARDAESKSRTRYSLRGAGHVPARALDPGAAGGSTCWDSEFREPIGAAGGSDSFLEIDEGLLRWSVRFGRGARTGFHGGGPGLFEDVRAVAYAVLADGVALDELRVIHGDWLAYRPERARRRAMARPSLTGRHQPWQEPASYIRFRGC